ncbi:MAG: GNAT family N-acetyltransferase [Gaiellaceae bacterium]
MIETARLSLRPLDDDDRERLFALWSDPANERVLGAASPAQIRAWIDDVRWTVWERETGELIGDCSLFFAEEHGEWELAYGLRREAWGRGFATEMARAAVAHGFGLHGLARIVADVDPANAASVRVLEKCGFVHVGGEPPTLLFELRRSSAPGLPARGA